MTSAFLAHTLLLSFRMLPLFVVAPITVFRRLPVMVRVVLTIALAMVFAGASATASAPTVTWYLLSMEFILGMTLAFGFHAAIGAVNAMGHVLDQQMGLAAAAVFDPSTDQTSSLIAETLTLAAFVGFLALDGHHAVLRGLSALTATIPPGTAVTPDTQLLQVLGMQFSLAFVLVAPIMVGMWLMDFALALASRAAPQANIYFVAIPVKLAIGLLVMAWLSSSMLPALSRMFGGVLNSWSASLGH